MKIILMRHGETVWNTQRRLQGCRDIPLTETGKEQIRIAGYRLASQDLHIDHIVSSPLERAYESAQIVAEALGHPITSITTSPFFLERSFGVCEGMTYEEAMEQYPDGQYPGMETLDQLYDRATQGLKWLEANYSDQTVLVTSHGAFIKAALGIASAGKIAYFDKDIWIDNGDCCTLEKTESAWTVSVSKH